MNYNLRIELDGQPTNAEVDRVITALGSLHPAVGQSRLGRLELTVTLPGANVGDVAVRGYQHALTLGRRIVALEITATEDFDRLNERAAVGTTP